MTRSQSWTRIDPRDIQRQPLEQALDTAILDLCIVLVEHNTRDAIPAVPLFSFLSAIYRHGKQGGWLPEDQASSTFSKLIYCCQLVVLAHAHRQVERRECEHIQQALDKLCPRWIVKGQKSPMADLLRFRSYSMKVDWDQVSLAPIRWRSDGLTCDYKDIEYHMDYLPTETSFCLKEARRVLRDELCFGLPNVPTVDLKKLKDDWTRQEPNASDQRIASI